MEQTNRSDVYERVTNQIIAAIDRGANTGEMPWHQVSADSAAPVNARSMRSYRGVNILSLWASSAASGFESRFWATYNQWHELGAQVKKGEKATLVVFWKFGEREEQSADEEGEGREGKPSRSILARGYSVFNASQVEGYNAPDTVKRSEPERIACAEQFFSVLGSDVRHGGNRAFYSPAHDYIQLPPFTAFRSAISYYSVRAHETTHWSGAPGRLQRDFSGRFGEAAYAAEELVAELGAAFLMADLELSSEPRSDHAGYIASWLQVLRNDKRAIFAAASKAQAAVDWMHQQQELPASEAKA